MPKLTIEFNPKMNEILGDLADERGTTKVDILRRAVALYKFLDLEQKAGNRISVTRGEKIMKDIVMP